jgi:hypothetical protein
MRPPAVIINFPASLPDATFFILFSSFLYISMFVTVNYLNAGKIFLLEPKGRGGGEIGPLLLFNPL